MAMLDEKAKVFSLASCDWIGFDLDHTLIRYRLKELHELIYSLFCDYLVQTHHYHRSLLDIPYDYHFAVKALIYDSLHGNLIQLNSDGYVHTALHGLHQRLTSKQIEEIYPNAFQEIEEDTSKRFLCIFTYFEQAIAYLIAHLVEMIDQKQLYDEKAKKVLPKGYSFFLKDLFDGFEYLFDDFNRGNYFPTVRDHPEKFIYQRQDVRQWLETLREKGKRLFLATNSRLDYTNVLCHYAFGSEWRTLFDIIVVDCKKPSFFAAPNDPNKRNLVKLMDSVYSQGNSADLHQMMRKISGKDPIVIYFGDHIKSDINALKRHTDWLAAAVVEELEYDVPPMTIHTKMHHPSKSPSTSSTYQIGSRSKYFSSFFTSPSDSMIFDQEDEQNEPDLLLKSLSSYWYTYITKHAHLSVSCLSLLANQFDYDHQFEHDEQSRHLILRNADVQNQ